MVWLERVNLHKKTSRNQRNWNVEQLYMQCNWFSFFLIQSFTVDFIFSFFLLLCPAQSAHICTRKSIKCMKLIGACGRLNLCARPHFQNEIDSIIFRAYDRLKAGRKSKCTVLCVCCCCYWCFFPLLKLHNSNHKCEYMLFHGCIWFFACLVNIKREQFRIGKRNFLLIEPSPTEMVNVWVFSQFFFYWAVGKSGCRMWKNDNKNVFLALEVQRK